MYDPQIESLHFNQLMPSTTYHSDENPGPMSNPTLELRLNRLNILATVVKAVLITVDGAADNDIVAIGIE